MLLDTHVRNVGHGSRKWPIWEEPVTSAQPVSNCCELMATKKPPWQGTASGAWPARLDAGTIDMAVSLDRPEPWPTLSAELPAQARGPIVIEMAKGDRKQGAYRDWGAFPRGVGRPYRTTPRPFELAFSLGNGWSSNPPELELKSLKADPPALPP
jgi:hypothetical protein